MVNIKQATANAVTFARESLGESRASGIRLEEIDSETVGGRDHWLITLSMLDIDAPGNHFAAITGMHGNREYKVFHVLKDTGEVTSMKVREFATN